MNNRSSSLLAWVVLSSASFLACTRGADAIVTITSTSSLNPIYVGDNFYGNSASPTATQGNVSDTPYGRGGYVLYSTANPAAGGFAQGDPLSPGAQGLVFSSNINLQSQSGTTFVTGSSPTTYVTIRDDGQTNGYGGYGYPNITEAGDPTTSALKAGLGGGSSTNGKLVDIIFSPSAPTTVGVGVLSDFADGGNNAPSTLTLSDSGGATQTITDTRATRTGNLYVFNISGAAGQTFTLSFSGHNGYYSGLTIDPVGAASAAPEPAEMATLSLLGLGLAGFMLRARRQAVLPTVQ